MIFKWVQRLGERADDCDEARLETWERDQKSAYEAFDRMIEAVNDECNRLLRAADSRLDAGGDSASVVQFGNYLAQLIDAHARILRTDWKKMNRRFVRLDSEQRARFSADWIAAQVTNLRAIDPTVAQPAIGTN